MCKGDNGASDMQQKASNTPKACCMGTTTGVSGCRSSPCYDITYQRGLQRAPRTPESRLRLEWGDTTPRNGSEERCLPWPFLCLPWPFGHSARIYIAWNTPDSHGRQRKGHGRHPHERGTPEAMGLGGISPLDPLPIYAFRFFSRKNCQGGLSKIIIFLFLKIL